MKKELPIERDNLVDVTECWTFEKLAIIQKSKFAEDWLASHLNIVMDYDYNVSFADSYYKYSPAYFDDILHARIIDMFEIENVVDELKEQINQNRYVKFFRWLVYGYDDEKQVLYVLMEKTEDNLHEISYTDAEKCYIEFREEFGKQDIQFGIENNRLHAAKNYQYPFVSYGINEGYSTVNCTYSALIKIDREIWSNKMEIADCTNDQIENPVTFYDGLSCLLGLEKLVNLYLNDDNTPNMYLSKTLKKLHEHRNLLLLSLKYIQKEWGINDPIVDQCIQDYNSCCKKLEIWCNLSLKYELNPNKELLLRILKNIPHELAEEKSILMNYRNGVYNWYNKNNIS